MRKTNNFFIEEAIHNELQKRKAENENLKVKVNKVIAESEEIKRLKEKIEGAYIGKEQLKQQSVVNAQKNLTKVS